MKIAGAEGMSQGQLNFEIQDGAKLVFNMYCISLLIITSGVTRRSISSARGESRFAKGLPWIVTTLLLGWVGNPLGAHLQHSVAGCKFQG